MGVVRSKEYRAPKVLFNRHLQTIYPALLRKVPMPTYRRERINTSDGDFLDLDWSTQENGHLVIICHGLEGNSSRPYVSGMVRSLVANGFNVLAWNYRGCSGEPNLKVYSYHSGATHDLETVVMHAVKKGYESISLVGFSLGGNMVLKYLGEDSTQTPSQVTSAVAFSVPLDLHDCAIQIHKPSNFLYEQRFLRSFRQKVKEKAGLFPEIDPSFLKHVKSVYDFDQLFTAPINGFENAPDYYSQCSSIKFVRNIDRPTLVVNALNDPFLGPECFNPKPFEPLDKVSFELTSTGGHCGFPTFGGVSYWSEKRAGEFIKSQSRAAITIP